MGIVSGQMVYQAVTRGEMTREPGAGLSPRALRQENRRRGGEDPGK